MDRETTSELRLLMETEAIQGEWRIWINGHMLTTDAFSHERVYDVGNRTTPLRPWLKAGHLNELLVAVRACHPADGLIHPLRVMGDFRIGGHPRVTLFPSKPAIFPGSWTVQGYPNASGRALYRRLVMTDFSEMPPGHRWILDCGDVQDSCRVYVNGQLAGTRLWKPFRYDLTQFINGHPMELVIEVANNAGNRIAGVSKPSGLIGPARIEIVPSPVPESTTPSEKTPEAFPLHAALATDGDF